MGQSGVARYLPPIALAAAVVVALVVAPTGGGSLVAPPVAVAFDCSTPNTYPGDNASQTDIARWMARGAIARQIPPELPVMAALVESDLHNLNQPDADSAGYFQMRKAIWDNGDYAGFPDHPDLQLKWFLDQATKVRTQHIAQGDTAYGTDPAKYGEWDADVEKPAERYRGRYQLRLDQARTVIDGTCDPGTTPPPTTGPTGVTGPTGPTGPTPPTPDEPECQGLTATKVGTDGNDKLDATEDDDVIVALGGDDRIRGLDGNDVLCAGPGDDKLVGGPGADDLYGEAGRDTLIGGSGHDRLVGGPGHDSQTQ